MTTTKDYTITVMRGSYSNAGFSALLVGIGNLSPAFDADSDMFKWLHIIVSNAKSFFSGTFHGLGKKNLQSYLDEYCYRFNRRAMDCVIFDRLLIQLNSQSRCDLLT